MGQVRNVMFIGMVRSPRSSRYLELSRGHIDGRPDYSPFSSDFRMRASILAGLKYVDEFMHPQVVITDNSGLEDTFFTSAVREKTNNLRTTLIELPRDATENLMWLTRLDSGSLRGEYGWNPQWRVH